MSSDEINRDKLLATLTRLAVKHEQISTGLARGMYDIATLLLPMIHRCEYSTGCDYGATVSHITLHIKYCDEHCARVIVSAKNESQSRFQNIQNSIKNPDNWIDVKNAESIRRISDYIKITKELEGDIITPARMH